MKDAKRPPLPREIVRPLSGLCSCLRGRDLQGERVHLNPSPA